MSLPAGVVGLLVTTRDTDWILVEESTRSVHRDGIVLHEVGHLLMHGRDSGHTCQHGAGQSASVYVPLLPVEDEAPEAALQGVVAEEAAPAGGLPASHVAMMSELLPDLDPRLIERMLARDSTYEERSERAAELVASMILERVWRPAAEEVAAGPDTRVGRIETALSGRPLGRE